MIHPGRASLSALAAVTLLGACVPAASEDPVELTVFAAASLSTALDAAARAYADADRGATITLSTDSSAALATQIAEGAPADVFVSADTTNPRKLVEAGLVDGVAVPIAGNGLVLITPTDNPAGLASPFDLAKPGVRIIAAGDAVPITTYATQLVENLAADPTAPAGFRAAYAANIVSKEDNVGAVRTKIELGEGDAAIVYRTDATTSDTVATIEVPAAANVTATYAGVVIEASAHADAAHAFLDWLGGPDGQAILADFGFVRPP